MKEDDASEQNGKVDSDVKEEDVAMDDADDVKIKSEAEGTETASEDDGKISNGTKSMSSHHNDPAIEVHILLTSSFKKLTPQTQAPRNASR